MKLLAICFMMFLGFSINCALPDLEENVQDFILEEKQIIIPGFKDAFNPSIIRFSNNKLLLIFRTRDKVTKLANLIGCVFLDESFNPEGTPELLKIYEQRKGKISKAQGPRIFKSRNRFYLAYNNILNDNQLEERRVAISELQYSNGRFSIVDPLYFLNFESIPNKSIEKNWSPFDFNGRIYFSYTLNPHIVFQTTQTQMCNTIANTGGESIWKWGDIHGGTPSLYDGNHYLGFFHSWIDMKSKQSQGKKISHYFIGAYLFEPNFPFAITHLSPEPIVGRSFYNAPNYPTWKPLKAVYPGGFIFDNNYIWMVYGRQDHECWVVKMDKDKLKKSLIPVEN